MPGGSLSRQPNNRLTWKYAGRGARPPFPASSSNCGWHGTGRTHSGILRDGARDHGVVVKGCRSIGSSDAFFRNVFAWWAQASPRDFHQHPKYEKPKRMRDVDGYLCWTLACHKFFEAMEQLCNQNRKTWPRRPPLESIPRFDAPRMHPPSCGSRRPVTSNRSPRGRADMESLDLGRCVRQSTSSCGSLLLVGNSGMWQDLGPPRSWNKIERQNQAQQETLDQEKSPLRIRTIKHGKVNNSRNIETGQQGLRKTFLAQEGLNIKRTRKGKGTNERDKLIKICWAI